MQHDFVVVRAPHVQHRDGPEAVRSMPVSPGHRIGVAPRAFVLLPASMAGFGT
jgi:hypothetical protein